MKRGTGVAVMMLAVGMFGGTLAAEAAGVQVGILGGISNTTGDGSKYMEIGFCGGLQAFVPLASHIMVGGRIAYHRWGLDEDELGPIACFELATTFPAVVEECDFAGHLAGMECCPSVRLVAPIGGSGGEVFAHCGAGLYRIDTVMKTDVVARTSSHDLTEMSESTDDFSTDFGINIGGGVLIPAGGFRVEVFPQYHVVYTGEDESSEFWSVSVGAVIPWEN